MTKTTEHNEEEPIGSYLLHPVILLCLGLWICNDHIFKSAYASPLTGKLSDVASLVVFPLLMLASIEKFLTVAGRKPVGVQTHNTVLFFVVFATGTVMATINLFDAAALSYEWGLGFLQWPVRGLLALVTASPIPTSVEPVKLWMDPSDCWTLPALIVPIAIARATKRPHLGGKNPFGKHGQTPILAEKKAI